MLEAKTKDEVELLAIGYKYNKKKVLCFLCTKGAGHTEPGAPYKACWKDLKGNTNSCDVDCPKVVAEYLDNNSICDLKNTGYRSVGSSD